MNVISSDQLAQLQSVVCYTQGSIFNRATSVSVVKSSIRILKVSESLNRDNKGEIVTGIREAYIAICQVQLDALE